MEERFEKRKRGQIKRKKKFSEMKKNRNRVGNLNFFNSLSSNEKNACIFFSFLITFNMKERFHILIFEIIIR